MFDSSKHSIRKFMGFLVAIIIVASVFNMPVLAEDNDSNLLSQFEKVAENDNFNLYVEIKTGNFALQNKANNYIWWSNPPLREEDPKARGLQKMNLSSHIIVEYLNKPKQTLESANNFIHSINKEGVKVEKTENGFIATYTFPDKGFSVPIKYTIEKDYFNVELIVSGIKEDGDNDIFSIGVLPYFGAGDAQDEGYMLVPDGSGAIIEMNSPNILNDNYSQKIYDTDSSLYKYKDPNVFKRARLPIMGIKKENDAIFAVITKGDADATVNAEMGGKFTSYNAAFFEFRLRSMDKYIFANERKSDINIYQDGPFGIDKCEIRYYPLEGENIGYSKMAEVYREYLVNNLGLERTDFNKSKFYLDIYGAVIKEKPILGIPFNTIEKLTTYKQAAEMIEMIDEAGIDNIVVRYQNWSVDSIKNKIPENARLERKLGGENEFMNMLQTFYKTGTEVYGSVDFLKVKKGASIFSRFVDFARNIRGILVNLFPYRLSTYTKDENQDVMHLTASDKIYEFSKSYFTSYKTIGMNGIALNDMSNILYSDFDKDAANLTITKLEVEKSLELADNSFNQVVGEGANGYTLPYIDQIVNMPVYSSGFDIVSYDIPFYQMVIHSFIPYATKPVNLDSSPNEMFLKAIQTGSNIHYSWIYDDPVKLKETELDYLYAAGYKEWLKTAVQQYEKISALKEHIKGRYMVDFIQIDDKVTKTVYEGDIQVIVNFGEESVYIDGMLVAAKDYIVVKGGKDIV